MPTLDELAAETPAMSSGSSLDEMAAEADLDQRFDKEDADRDAIGLPRLSDAQRQSTKRRLLVPARHLHMRLRIGDERKGLSLTARAGCRRDRDHRKHRLELQRCARSGRKRFAGYLP